MNIKKDLKFFCGLVLLFCAGAIVALESVGLLIELCLSLCGESHNDALLTACLFNVPTIILIGILYTDKEFLKWYCERFVGI